MVAQNAYLRYRGCTKCKFAQSRKVIKLTYLFDGVPKYWIYSKTFVKRLEGVQHFLLCVNLKQITYKCFFSFFFLQEKNHHKDVLEKTC